ncbi:HET-domain-containing protein [Hypoxylon rubiginosum]|uniref:HET-domain-containing protein n=1 Tax=Hypoxylon rubiginosum TaxID=110542 RepID=A0ACC0D087_9PEZI|nr:HET-domain-containing protein [Hypoxylon rubiginosum]
MAFCSLHRPKYRPASTSFKTTTTLERMVCSESKCPICGLILEAVEHHMPGWITSPENVRTHIHINIVDYGRENFQRVHFREMFVGRLGQVDWKNDFSFNVIQRPLRRIESRPLRHPLTCCDQGQLVHAQKDPEPPNQLPATSETIWDVLEDSTTQAAFDRAARWLSQCMEYDKPCKPPDVDFNPRRLLSVGQVGEPFLVKPTEPTAYACLSYCWGESVDVLKTTKTNLQSHYQEIPVASMPKSVQDAVKVCRGIGISYLWVDSLCIVQDDANAWHHDASMMDRIYLNAQLTIAALEPSSCKIGFLGKQRFGLPGWQRQHKFHDTLQEVIIRREPKTTSEYSLDKRAWCLQETLLSQRRLCFDGNEMSWECLCRQVCECGHQVWQSTPSGCARNDLSLMQLGALFKKNGGLSVSVPKLNTTNPYLDSLTEDSSLFDLWRHIVSDYSRRSLSRQSDKLMALAGLARIITGSQNENYIGSEYIAGLWTKEFFFDLAWRITTFKPEPNDPDRRRFPSWSWASRSGVISYNYAVPLPARERHKFRASKVLTCSLRGFYGMSIDGIPTTEGGRICLEGDLIPVKLKIVKERIPLTSNTPQERSTGISAYIKPQNIKVYLDEPVCLAAGQDASFLLTNHYCFRLFSWIRVYQGDIPYTVTQTRYLVLKLSCRVEGAFERIGISIVNARQGSYETSWLFDMASTEIIDIV